MHQGQLSRQVASCFNRIASASCEQLPHCLDSAVLLCASVLPCLTVASCYNYTTSAPTQVHSHTALALRCSAVVLCRTTLMLRQ
jgi:hypothetical protein